MPVSCASASHSRPFRSLASELPRIPWAMSPDRTSPPSFSFATHSYPLKLDPSARYSDPAILRDPIFSEPIQNVPLQYQLAHISAQLVLITFSIGEVILMGLKTVGSCKQRSSRVAFLGLLVYLEIVWSLVLQVSQRGPMEVDLFFGIVPMCSVFNSCKPRFCFTSMHVRTQERLNWTFHLYIVVFFVSYSIVSK